MVAKKVRVKEERWRKREGLEVWLGGGGGDRGAGGVGFLRVVMRGGRRGGRGRMVASVREGSLAPMTGEGERGRWGRRRRRRWWGKRRGGGIGVVEYVYVRGWIDVLLVNVMRRGARNCAAGEFYCVRVGWL